MIDPASRQVLDLARSVLAELERFVTSGINERTRARIGDLPRGRGVLGDLIEHPAPLRLEDVGAHPRSYGFPAGHPPMQTFLGVPIVISGRAFGNLYLTEKAGGEQFTAEDAQAAVVLAEFAAVAIENAQLYGGAKHQRDELERTVATLEATTHITRAVGDETDMAVVLEMVAKRGRALVSARVLVIELFDGVDHLTIAVGAGEWSQSMEGERVPLKDTVAEIALRTLQTQRLEDELNRARFDQHGLGRLGVRAEAGLAVPLVFNGRPHGVLMVIDRLEDGPGFTAGDVRLLEAFASSAATAVATAKSVATDRTQQRLAAAEAERTRWARELHDETLQRLAALQIALSYARRSGLRERMEEAIDNARGLLESEIANLRSLISELRPPTLDELGLSTALEALGARATSQGMDVDVSVEMASGLNGGAIARHTAELETAIYRLVQEALTNAATHGKARRTVVEVQESEGAVHVSVRDDGDGFDTAAQTDGFGLLGMRERVDMVDGDLQIDSGAGGTTVNAVFPVRRGVRPESAARPQALRVSALPSPR